MQLDIEYEQTVGAASYVEADLAGTEAGAVEFVQCRFLKTSLAGSHFAQVRMTEQPPGIEQAEEAALELERVIGAPPRVASPAFLDDVGTATRALEEALGQLDSPFASALRSSSGAMDGFLADVETRYNLPLS